MEDEPMDEFTRSYFESRKAIKSKEEIDREQKMKDNVFAKETNLGLLRHALLKHIKQEDYDVEFIVKDQFPLGCMFGQSLDEHLTGCCTNQNSDVAEAEELAVRALAHKYIYQARNDINSAIYKCQSPLEVIMFAALVIVNAKKGQTLVIGGSYRKWPFTMIHKAGNSSGVLKITPQARISDYTVDFLLESQAIRILFPDEATESIVPGIRMVTKPELAAYQRYRKRLIVECDGHDSHEKTKEQAAYDKRRDRHLQTFGYKVFRFSGSEIHRDAIACAEEVFDGFILDSGTSTFVDPPQR